MLKKYVAKALFEKYCWQSLIKFEYLFLAQPDEFVIGWSGSERPKVELQNSFTALPLCCGYNVQDLFTGWHKHCFTFKSAGEYKVY